MRAQSWVRAMALLMVALPLACKPADPAKQPKGKAPEKEPEVQVEDLREGTGEPAKPGDWLVLHYTGWLTDGTKFDSSLDNQEPFELRLGHGDVIKGWDNGLVGMKAGGKRKLTIPSELAYGKRGRPPIIPGDATLIFEVELLRIKR